MDVYNFKECLYLLKLIGKDCNNSQRELAKKSSLSLGKVNHRIKALIEIVYLKIKNFQNPDSKLNYIYLLTPIGVINKTLIAKWFLLQKQQECDKLGS